MSIASETLDKYELGSEVSEIASSIIPEVSANVSDVISTLNSFTPNITGTDLN